jgi:hypothetical protein
MAQDPATAARLNALCQRSAQARAVLSQQIGIFRHRVNLPARLRESVSANPYAWFGGSLVAGLLTTLLFRRKSPCQKSPPRKSWLSWLLATAITSAKPFLKAWLVGELKSRIRPLLQRQYLSR